MQSGELSMSDINGTAGGDNIYGTNTDDVIFGGDGNDVLRGFGGSDTLFGGEGNDSLQGGDGGDDMYGGNGNDTYYVFVKEDQVTEDTAAGTDTVVSYLYEYKLGANVEVLRLAGNAYAGRGNELDNGMQGNALANVLGGAGGNDSIYGMAGDDVLYGGTGNDIIDGGADNDLVSYKDISGGVTVDMRINNRAQNTGAGGNDFIRSVERLEGSEFDDVLTGDAGDNKIAGLGGNDRIRGVGGNDELLGGAGADTFAFEAAGAANGFDVVRGGFVSGFDKLEFRTADGYSATAGFTAGSAAVGSGAQFVFNAATHTLSYDADGDGAGAAVAIAAFLPDTGVTAGDIVIV